MKNIDKYIYRACIVLITLIVVFFGSEYLLKQVGEINYGIGSSMSPTLNTDDTTYDVGYYLYIQYAKIERFDIVNAIDLDGVEVTKRIIGLPGETLKIENEILYINGEPVEQDFLNNEYANSYREANKVFDRDVPEITLGEDEYFIMGDNRPLSLDSRKLGPIKYDDIISKLIVIWEPEFKWFGL